MVNFNGENEMYFDKNGMVEYVEQDGEYQNGSINNRNGEVW